MHAINSTTAFIKALRNVLSDGVIVEVRGNRTRELTNQCINVYGPHKRVVMTPHRNPNIFAQVAETIWVLGGYNDMEYLSHYLHRATDFSDDSGIWRGAYGPRLRNYGGVDSNGYVCNIGVDQIKAVTHILDKDPYSRQAVIMIYDPTIDTGVSSKDIPCNQWLQFMIRDGKLIMGVVVRSNDVMWGFSGINMFEWSVLHEMIANWLNVEVGKATYYVGSMHVYERHWKRARKILDCACILQLYSATYNRPNSYRFFANRQNVDIPPFPDTDSAFKVFFEIEKDIRINGIKPVSQDMGSFLSQALHMAYIWKKIQDCEAGIVDVVAHISEYMLDTDFAIAALEYVIRHYAGSDPNKIFDELRSIENLLTDKTMRFFYSFYGM